MSSMYKLAATYTVQNHPSVNCCGICDLINSVRYEGSLFWSAQTVIIDELAFQVKINHFKSCVMFHGILQMLIFYSVKPRHEILGILP